MKKLLIFLLIVVLSVFAIGCDIKSEPAIYQEVINPQHDKAIILVGGLMSSVLYNESGDTAYWNTDISRNLAIGHKGNMENLLACDNEGVPKLTVKVANMASGEDAYGVSSQMKIPYDYLVNRYGNDYDIINWQYDWRQSLNNSAEKLDIFLTKCNYGKLIFLSHSMGSSVVARYLALGEKQRENIELFVSYGGAFLGAVDALGMIYGDENVENHGYMGAMQEILKVGGVDYLEHIRNMESIYDLFPNSLMFEDNPNNEIGIVNYNYKKSNINEMWNAVKSEEWAQYKKKTKPFLTDKEYGNESTILDNKHITEYIPTIYVAGIGYNTNQSCVIENGKLINYLNTEMGDSLITVYSATAGTIKNNDILPKNIVLCKKTHNCLITRENLKTVFDKFDRKSY